jgi:iron complex outermembrane recepter protein
LTLLLAALPIAAQEESSPAALKRLSVEELMNVEVTSVSRSRENLGRAAAAVAIVTNDDIRRSGALSIPEALRFVPGLHVARTTADTWAVSSRGFSGVNSEDLLVLSDTRSVYTPLFSGVFWDVQDFLMEDLDRIEVIRGPGAALWGSNAVNGVINILSKSAEDTQGAYVAAGSGNEERVTGAARYGGKFADSGYYRVFGKYVDQKAGLDPAGSGPDDWQLGHVGFRSDWKASTVDALTLQGDLYDGRMGQVFPAVNIIGRPGPTGPLRAAVGGGNVLGRWTHAYGDDSDLQLRLYYDRTHRNDPTYVDNLDTIDVDFQHRFPWAHRQEVIWGLSYRRMQDRNSGKGIFALNPPDSRDTLVSGFVQDQVTLRDSLHVTLGTKLEHNDFSGFEVQPNLRAARDLSNTATLWAAVSRAVRVPTRLERDVAIYVTNPTANPAAILQGNRSFHSEEMRAFELGYRWQTRPNLSMDLAAFYNRYRDLASLELGTPYVNAVTGQTVLPIINRNLTDGWTTGLEALITYSPRPEWRVSLDYSYLDMSLDSHGRDLNRGKLAEGATPRNQVGVRSSLDLPAGLELDAQLRALSAIRSLAAGMVGEGVPGYEELDVRLAWHGFRQLELSLDGRNLLHDHHVEFGAPLGRSALRRSVYGQITWGL